MSIFKAIALIPPLFGLCYSSPYLTSVHISTPTATFARNYGEVGVRMGLGIFLGGTLGTFQARMSTQIISRYWWPNRTSY